MATPHCNQYVCPHSECLLLFFRYWIYKSVLKTILSLSEVKTSPSTIFAISHRFQKMTAVLWKVPFSIGRTTGQSWMKSYGMSGKYLTWQIILIISLAVPSKYSRTSKTRTSYFKGSNILLQRLEHLTSKGLISYFKDSNILLQRV